MKKAPEAFRTISEVSDLLETPAHVLRFWESKFYQIRPVKRAGGRRYYRPDDVALINGIRLLLQDGGLTIRGVQRILQEKGLRHVIDMGAVSPADASGDTFGDPSADLTESAKTDRVAAGAAMPPAVTPAPAPRLPKLPDTPLRPAWPLHLMPEPSEADLIEAEQTAARGQGAGRAETGVPAADPAELDAPARLPKGAPTESPSQIVQVPPKGMSTPARQSGAPVVAAPAVTPIPDARGDVPERQFDRRPSVAPPPPPDPVEDPADLPTEPRLPHLLRQLPHDGTGTQRARALQIARRLDALLERMSEASGAGRW